MSSSIAGRLAHLPQAPKRPAQPRARLDTLIEPRDTEFGRLHLVEHHAGPAQHVDPASLAALALTQATLDTTRPLYFDTETTGLAGGTGTLAFLLGTAEVRDGQVLVSQVHLPGPGQERPMLQWLASRIEASTLLLSFNGRSFDWPLLRSRYVMNRLPPPPERPHVDLLHCARRVFRHHLDELKLSTLERRVLDVHRRGDIEGALIPPAWFDYLRTGRVAVLARVLSHNERDVRSMVDLVNRLVAAWEERHPVLPATALGLATVAARHGDDARALRFLRLATEGAVAEHAWSLEAELRRRRGEYREAVDALLCAVARSSSPAPLHLRLAKLYEHRLHDLALARSHAELCSSAEEPQSHARRHARLAPSAGQG
ncbi:MAG: ribonuclease H-like domain-containing protein [Archangium sp.]|nr:ribonuclease H-like domain-containing protein [Archangium sp.]